MAEGLVHTFSCCGCRVALPVTLNMGVWSFAGAYRPDLQEHNPDKKYRSAFWCPECLEKMTKSHKVVDKYKIQE